MADAPRNLAEVYPKGSRIQGLVDRIEPFGVFVRFEEEPRLVGLIRPRDWSWERPGLEFKPNARAGQRITVEILAHRRAGIDLSRRAILPDPYPEFRKRHAPGDVISAQVAFITRDDSGVVVTLEGGIDGFIPRSEIPDYGQRREGFGLLADDWVIARISGFRDTAREVTLSIREHLRRRESGARTAAELSTSTLRHHPKVGPALEDYGLNLELKSFQGPEISSAVRERIKKILVVENDLGVSDSLDLYLELLGFRCTLVGTVGQGMDQLKKDRYDLLILDINLPGEKGLDLVRNVHQRSRPPFVLVLTGAALDDWEQLLDEEGKVSGIFQKPTSLAGIFAFLDRLITQGDARDDRRHRAGFEGQHLESAPAGLWQSRGRVGQRLKIERLLANLRKDTGADASFVLAYRPGPAYELVAGDFPALTRDVQQQLEISPVGSIIRRRELLVAEDVSKDARRFTHLLKVHPIGCFAGTALDYRDNAEYGLFLTARQAFALHFDNLRGLLVNAASMIGHFLAEERLDSAITESQGLLLTGFLADSLLHEIKNSSDALNHYTAIQSELGKRHATDLAAMTVDDVIRFKRAVLGIHKVSQQLEEVIHLFRNLAGQTQELEINLNRTVERLEHTLKALAEDKSIVIENDLDPEVPELRLNPKLVDQPLLNVMINAIEQMALVGGTDRFLRIATRYRPEEQFPIIISISDTGPGIHTIHSERIFDLFFTTKERGTGLGLYLSRFFLERLGGRVYLAESAMFSGSRFVVELPREVVA